MSSVLAIAGVTAVLRDLLDNGLIDQVTVALGTGFAVSAVAPDTIKLDADAQPRLNLFLYQVTPNLGWRNVALPSRDFGGRRITSPPLALDLHYLLTAYGSLDLQAEVLLGYAMQLLHETPVLARDAIRTALQGPASPVGSSLLPAVYKALRASDLAGQLEQLKITPTAMNSEEMSKLWTALQAHYRPTASYQISVVLIDSVKTAKVPLPVLTRGMPDPVLHRDQGVIVQATPDVPFAEIDSVTLPNNQIAALLGDSITFGGQNLDGSGHMLLLSNQRLGIDRQVTPATTVTPTAVTFALSPAPDQFPAGTYTASVQLVRPGEASPRTTNEMALSVAPTVQVPASVQVDQNGDAEIAATCSPLLLPAQRVSLVVGEVELPPDPFSAPTPTASFTYAAAPVGGPYRVRLRVDGVDSPVVDRNQMPPVFTGPTLTITS